MGIGAQMLLWPDGFCEALAARGYQVVRFDHRDVGGSTRLDHLGQPSVLTGMARWALRLRGTAPYTLTDMAGDTMELLDGLGVDAAHVVGASRGGMIAQELAIHWPHKLRSLTSIMSGVGRRRDLLGQPGAALTLLAPYARDRASLIRRHERLLRVLYAGDDPPTRDEIAGLVDRMSERGLAPEGFQRHLAALLASRDRSPALANLDVPTLVIHGRADPLVPPRAGAATARAIPGARLRWIEGMGHGFPRARWPVLIDAIAAHFARVDRE